jgi:RNA recognition motif-containing protein
VEFANASDAAKALKEMDGKEIKWRAIRVGFAKENPDKIQKTEEVTE